MQHQQWIPSEAQLRVNDLVYQCESNRSERARAQQRAAHVADTRRTVAALLATPTRSALVPLGGGKAFVRATAQVGGDSPVLASIGDDYFLPCATAPQLDALLNRRSDAIRRAVDELDSRFAQLHAQLEQIQSEASLDDDPAALLDIAEPLLDDDHDVAASTTIDLDDNASVAVNLSGASSNEQMARDLALIASVFDRFNGLADTDDAVAPAPQTERHHAPLHERTAPAEPPPQPVGASPVSNVVVERRAHSTAPDTTSGAQSTQPARVSLFKQRRQQQQQQQQQP